MADGGLWADEFLWGMYYYKIIRMILTEWTLVSKQGFTWDRGDTTAPTWERPQDIHAHVCCDPGQWGQRGCAVRAPLGTPLSLNMQEINKLHKSLFT